MKKLHSIGLNLALMSLLLTMCVPTPTTEPASAPTDVPGAPSATPDPDSPTPTLMPGNPSYSDLQMPEILIIIDNSLSVFEAQGYQICDPDHMRYKIADFILRVIVDLKANGVLSKEQRVRILVMDPRGMSWDVDIQKRIPTSSSIAAPTPESGEYHGLRYLFTEIDGEIAKDATVFLITDADFRTNRNESSISDKESPFTIKVWGDELSRTSYNFLVFNLCPDRGHVSDASILGIWDTWASKSLIKIYNNKPDPEADITQSVINALTDFLNETNFQQEGDGFRRTWQILTKNGLSVVNSPIQISPYMVSVNAGAIRFNQEQTTFYDGVLVDGQAPRDRHLKEFYAPLDVNDCSKYHTLKYGATNQPDENDFVFLWWEVQEPIFSVAPDASIIEFYNNQPEEIALILTDALTTQNFHRENWLRCLIPVGSVNGADVKWGENRESDSVLRLSIPSPLPHSCPLLEDTGAGKMLISINRKDGTLLQAPFEVQYYQKFQPQYGDITLLENRLSFFLTYGYHNLYAVKPTFRFLGCNQGTHQPDDGQLNDGFAITTKNGGYHAEFSQGYLSNYLDCQQIKISWPDEEDWPGGYSDEFIFNQEQAKCFDFKWDHSSKLLNDVVESASCLP